ncbi:DeoR/GlpR family DNA-binding transcription regulator [Halobacillus litoralis]|uniref:DeoR/GlpR family DNA-binding transcription regulator n=1 Tax=Halobacillus litoralis TaxID=45668 RepID=UPI00273E4126|nr:DeoR/GlpR family DNA-binding transcription regulator [Halobacillus litoralis]WLR46619.1 DeoR/GlpR family DNA-binding transcription regulator [Halobacillus litoralis]
MVPQDRQNEIMKLLQEFRSMKINVLCERLKVSRETIRKDLYEMEEQGLIKKVHGGAILNKANFETKYVNRKNTNFFEKKSIAEEASKLVEDGDTIYIDYGTTALLFSRELMHRKDLTIITNSLPIANELVDYTDFQVVVLGGIIRKGEKSMYGSVANLGIQNLYVDTGFFGIAGIDIEAGYTNFHMGESEVSRMMVQHSKKTVIMADFSKFNTTAMNKVAELEEVDVLITDESSSPDVLHEFKSKEMKVIVADVKRSEGFEQFIR